MTLLFQQFQCSVWTFPSTVLLPRDGLGMFFACNCGFFQQPLLQCCTYTPPSSILIFSLTNLLALQPYLMRTLPSVSFHPGICHHSRELPQSCWWHIWNLNFLYCIDFHLHSISAAFKWPHLDLVIISHCSTSEATNPEIPRIDHAA